MPRKAKKCTKSSKNMEIALPPITPNIHRLPHTTHSTHCTACATFSTLVSINCLLNGIPCVQQTQVSENQIQNKDFSVNCC